VLLTGAVTPVRDVAIARLALLDEQVPGHGLGLQPVDGQDGQLEG
jgi:hypothetical protein